MYYLVNIKIIRPNWIDSEFKRLVKARDKNNAFDKTNDYLVNTYITHGLPENKGLTWKIEIEDTIE